MHPLFRSLFLISVGAALCLTSCEELQTNSSSSSLNASASATTDSSATPLSKHDVALRFLTAFIRLDRSMAMQYATPEALSKLNWNAPHRGNIPYYDDKMLLQFNGGWARVFFQDTGNTFRICDFEVHSR
ncbi:MAG: hypothetical protein KA250_01755 [Verrucomicrobiales bacterium]|nr:hypothetical protein [Verrucomicrobiales bacterium]